MESSSECCFGIRMRLQGNACHRTAKQTADTAKARAWWYKRNTDRSVQHLVVVYRSHRSVCELVDVEEVFVRTTAKN